MENLVVKYRTEGKALPPRPIRLSLPGWGGSEQLKRENGSQPQPWHCPPFSEAATHGVELVYPYDTECHVVNEGGAVRIDWDYSREPGVRIPSDEMTLDVSRRNYLFGTSTDLQAPPGYVLRTEPHPRALMDPAGTAPTALCGHVRSEWWAKKLFVVFRAPGPGRRHVFRKGEPYVQILFVPDRGCDLQRMSAEEEARRQRTEEGIKLAKSLLAKRVWHAPNGLEFNDHYKVLHRAFDEGGVAGVEAAVNGAVGRHREALPADKSVRQYLDLAGEHHRAGRHVEAKEALFQARRLDPANAEAGNRMGRLALDMKLPELAIGALRQAVAMAPTSFDYRMDLGGALAGAGRHEEAEGVFRSALQLRPDAPEALAALAMTQARLGRSAAAPEACRRAAGPDGGAG